jgi:hypothetical protein
MDDGAACKWMLFEPRTVPHVNSGWGSLLPSRRCVRARPAGAARQTVGELHRHHGQVVDVALGDGGAHARRDRGRMGLHAAGGVRKLQPGGACYVQMREP